MGQDGVTTPVRRLLVATSFYDDEAIVGIELSSRPFSAEKKTLGRRGKNATGFLIASYDQ